VITDLPLTQPQRSEMSQHWSLDPATTFLNHGSFGACPIAVLAKQQILRQRLEQDPVHFFVREYEEQLDNARQELAAFVGVDAADLVFVPNATAGVNTVLRSLVFQPEDELLTSSHEYNASRNALDFAAEQAGAQVVVAEIPFPIASPDQVIAALLAKVSSKTRLLLIDHVTSQTGLVMPIQPLIAQLAAQGIDTLVDGAHAPGMLPLQLSELGAAFYTGNCHKWLCAPKGAAFLFVRPDRQTDLRPLAISHGANSTRIDRSRFQLEFDWTGTDDPTAYLCIPEAIQYMGSLLSGGWPALMAQNRELAIAARTLLCEALQISPPCPVTMLGSLASLPLPNGSWQSLYQILYDRFQIQVQIMPWTASPNRLLRISAQLYNQLEDYQYLAAALKAVLAAEI
jgi:isopenicillin-N epimerase